MPTELFDMRLRAMRRDRAARLGPETFLFERAFEDCLERLQLMPRRFDHALLLGCPDPAWPHRLTKVAEQVRVADPGPLFAAAAGGETIVEDRTDFGAGQFDMCLAIGTLDTVNDLRAALRSLHRSLMPNSLFIGTVVGGDSLPRLRLALRAADAQMGAASPHVHPRIEASSVAPLLVDAGFVQPVIDVDRVQVTYSSLAGLIRDLRAMGATNLLTQRSRRPFTKAGLAVAQRAFKGQDGARASEQFELLHFAAWKAPGS